MFFISRSYRVGTVLVNVTMGFLGDSNQPSIKNFGRSGNYGRSRVCWFEPEATELEREILAQLFVICPNSD